MCMLNSWLHKIYAKSVYWLIKCNNIKGLAQSNIIPTSKYVFGHYNTARFVYCSTGHLVWSYCRLCCISQRELVWFLRARGRGTYTAGTVNSVPLLKVERKSVYFPSHFWWPHVLKMHQTARICNYIFKNFPGVTPTDSQNWGGCKPPLWYFSPLRAPTVQLFQGFCGRCLEQDFSQAECPSCYPVNSIKPL